MTKLLHGNEKSSLTGGREPLFSQKELLVLAVPLLVEQLLEVTVGMADTMMVSRCGEAAISVRFASIQGRFSRTNDATNASAACSGADTSTWPSAFTRRFTFLMRLRTSRTGSPSTSRVIVVGAAAPPRRLAVGRPVRPAPRPAMPLTP